MLIKDIQAIPVSIPLEQATRMSTRTVTSRQYVLVTVRTDSDVEGVGFTYVGTGGALATCSVINEVLAPAALGRDVHDADHTWTALYAEALLIGRRGLVLRAMSALDIAMHDAASRAAGLPLAKYLGGWKERVPAYASGGYYREGDPLEAIRQEISFNQELGFRDHKIKVGGADLKLDTERVALARELAGDSGRLALDANNAYLTFDAARRAASAFEKAAEDLWWIEEPLSPEDVEGHARLAECLATPVATGEIHQTRWDFQRLLEGRAMGINQADAGVVGGIREWMRIADMSAGFGVRMAPHWHANLHVHLVAATANADIVEHFSLEKDIFNFERLVAPDSRLVPVDGSIPVPTAPGLGIEWAWDQVDRFRL